MTVCAEKAEKNRAKHDKCSVARSQIYALSLHLYSYYIYAINKKQNTNLWYPLAICRCAGRNGPSVFLYLSASLRPICNQLATKARRYTRQLAFDTERILGECLLISSVPGKALRTLVDIARLAERFNMRSQSRAWYT